MAIKDRDFPGIVGGFNQQFEPRIDRQRTFNMYKVLDRDGNKPRALLATPGKRLETEIGVNRVRQLFEHEDILYAVINDAVYRFDIAFTPTLLGNLNTTTGYVGVEANDRDSGAQIIFVDGVDGWIWDTGTSMFTQITDPDFLGAPRDVAYQDGYFIVVDGDTDQWQLSAINDGLDWPTEFVARANSRPDTLIGVAELHRRVFLFSTDSVEVWHDAGAASFPFRRDNSLLLEYGCAAVGSIAKGYERIIWLSQNTNGAGPVMMVTGTRPIPISTTAIDIQLQSLSPLEASEARAFIYKQDGHIFYVLSFTSFNKTFCFDVTTAEWHERGTLAEDRDTAECHAFFNNTHYVGAFNEPKILEYSTAITTDEGVPRKYRRVTPPIYTEGYEKTRINRLDVKLLHGDATANGEGSDPEIRLAVSRDGGQTFGNVRSRKIGRLAQWLFRTRWHRLGTSDSFVLDFEATSINKFGILGAAANIDELPQ